MFPLAQAALVAAFDGVWTNAPTLFGGTLAGHGLAIYVTAEDDAIEVHNRLNALGPIPDRLYVLPLPDAGDAVPLFAPGPATRGPSTIPAWLALEQQLTLLAGLRLIILDPLQPLCALDLNVPENAQFVSIPGAGLRSRLPASRPGTQGRAGTQNTCNGKYLKRYRPQAFPDRGGNAQTQQRRDFPGLPSL